MTYATFLKNKRPLADACGLSRIPELSSHLFPFQADVTAFALRKGRCGMYLSTGLGKTLVGLEFSKHAAEATNGTALVLTPLAVAYQFDREGKRFGYDCRVIRSQDDVAEGINICNYDRLDKLDPDAFGSVVLDESSCLKGIGGKIAQQLTSAFAQHRFKMAASATPAPNDHMELGQQCEFLGVMNSVEMLSRWFINDTSSASQKWRLKGHAIADFWNWVASWARLATLPSDLGYSDEGYILPKLNVIRHKARNSKVESKSGDLFTSAASATTMFALKRQTEDARADLAAQIVQSEPNEPWVLWVDTNSEADKILERLPFIAADVRGSLPNDIKDKRIRAFLDGSVKVLITKSSICGFGLNFQFCARTAFVGRTFSFESWFQAVRRFHRFGQKRQVDVHLIIAEGEDQTDAVIARKEREHERMRVEMAAAMRRNLGRESQRMVGYNPQHKGKLPAWLISNESVSGTSDDLENVVPFDCHESLRKNAASCGMSLSGQDIDGHMQSPMKSLTLPSFLRQSRIGVK